MSDQPSVLICCFDVLPGPSGLSRRVTEYLKGLGDRYQAVVLSNKTPDHSHIERYQLARLLRVPIGSGDLQSRIQAFDRAVRRQLESEEYQLVHFFDPFGGYALCEQRENQQREGPAYRLIYDAQTFPSQELRYTHPHTEGDRRFLSKIRRQELFCLMNSDAVITGSEVTRKFILDQGVPEAQVRVLRAPVEVSLYSPEVLGRPDASPMKILYLGSQLGYQGLPTLLRAMQLAIRQVDVRLTIVGPKHTEWQAHLLDLVNELKLAGKVEFQAPVIHDDLHKIVATCDVGALTLDDNERNRNQGGPLSKLGEYLAGGRPVIASDLPITRELVPEAAGVFFPCGDFKRLAEQLILLAQDPERRVAMGKAARAAAEKVDASWIRGQLLDLYVEVAGRVRAPLSPDAIAEITRAGKLPVREPNTPKTDPAMKAPEEPPAGTDPEGNVSSDAPAILGTPLRTDEDQPRTAVTDRVSVAGPPVVMGTPLAAEAATPTPRELPAVELISARPITAAKGVPPVKLSNRPITAAKGVPPVLVADRPQSAPRGVPATPSRGSSEARSSPTPRSETRSGERAPVSRPTPAAKPITGPRGFPAAKAPENRATPARGSARARDPMPEPTPIFRAGPPVDEAAAPTPRARAAAQVGGGITAENELPPEVTPVHGPPTALSDAPPEPTPIRRPPALRRAASGSFPAATAGTTPSTPGPHSAEVPVAPSAASKTSETINNLPPITRATGASGLPAVRAIASPVLAPSPPPPEAAADEEIQEIGDDEVLDPAAQTGDEDANEGVDEAQVMEMHEAEAHAIESNPEPLPSNLDPWLAQLVHGYCPSDSAFFNRHTPPTNFPGRD